MLEHHIAVGAHEPVKDPGLRRTHVLAFMPAVVDLAVAADHPGLAGTGYVAGLDRVDAELFVQGERRIDLAFVVRGVGRGLVVGDQVDALGPGVSGQLDQVVVGVGLAEIEVLAVAEPVAVPADVPASTKTPPR